MSEFHYRYVGRDGGERRDAFARLIACGLRDPLMIADATLKQVESDLDPDSPRRSPRPTRASHSGLMACQRLPGAESLPGTYRRSISRP